MSRTLALTGLLLVLAAPFLSPVASVAYAGDANKISVKSWLHGDASMRAVATYQQRTKSNGNLKKRLHVKLRQAAPFETYMVRVNSMPAGVITTNAAGNGKLRINSRNQPTVMPGFDITVGPLSGIFYDRSAQKRNKNQRFRVRTQLESDGDAVGHAKYHERYKKGDLRRDFMVVVTDAEPNTTYEVMINGATEGELTTDEFGEGKLKLRTAEFIHGDHDDDDEGDFHRPMPDDFPAILAGDTIEVGPLSGEFRRQGH